MKWILVLFSVLPLAATDNVNFFNLKVDRGSDGLTITAEPEPFLDYKLLKNEEYSLDKPTYDHMLDAPLRQTAFLMRTLDRNRGTIVQNKEADLPIISYRFELTPRKVTGEPISEIEYKVTIGLDPEPGIGYISCEPGAIRHTFNIAKIKKPSEYEAYITNIAFPFGKKTIPIPNEDEFLIDLYFRWPEVEVSNKDFDVLNLFPSLIVWDRGDIRKLKIHLATTYCYKNEQGWQQVSSDHTRTYKDSIQTYTGVLQTEEGGDEDEIIAELEEYLDGTPADKKALKKLMDYYVELEKHTEAYSLITRFEPFFATIRDGLANRDDLAGKAERRRARLMGKKGSFERDRGIKIKIINPVQNDLVTGTTTMQFTLDGGDRKLLDVECYLEEQLINRLTGPPYEVDFNVDGAQGRLGLRVVAYYENETYNEHEIFVKTFKVDEEEQVQLVALRASVFQARSADGRELTKEDFTVKENKVEKKIEHFRKSSAPLRVAILMDTSISMFGPKLYRAQYAVKTFLSKMEPEDRVSIYSFDDRVLKLSDFTADYDGVTPELMTLSPRGSTSLYDGMLIAHDALMGQNGTKVIIVISDGDDSNSSTTDLHVANLLKRSPVMVYSVILPGGFLGNPDKGLHFLREMARLSGSISTKVRDVDKLDETFERIYQDLKSFYYLDYYSEIVRPEDRKIRVKVKSSGATIRTRTIN